jgi:tripartite-type tricarboxylate transporter receptor subunit TctC
VFYVQSRINRAFFAPPGVPADRLTALRKAFMATMADKEVKAEATKMKLDLDASPGEEVQAIVERLYATPPAIIERMKRATASGG